MAPGSSDKRGAKKKKSKGKKTAAVTEATRIRVAHILEQFQISDKEVYKFEDALNNSERAAVHVLSRKMGFKSKSKGIGQQRRISVYNAKKAVGKAKGRENLISFRFSEVSNTILQDLFSRYPLMVWMQLRIKLE